MREHEAEIAIASPVWHELVFGLARLPAGEKRDAIARFLEEVLLPNVPILPYDDRAAEWHAHERARLVASGRTPPFVDGQIAAVAHVHRLALVTRNLEDFRAFGDLALIDWSRP